MLPFEIIDERFQPLVLGNAGLETLWTDGAWTEGPVYFADGDFLLWSDIPNNRIMQWVHGAGARVFRQPAENTNGHTRDRQGRLISCEHRTRRVTRTEYDGRITVLADRHEGKRLNSPNDVVVTLDDAVWFTDPHYGIITDYEGDKAPQEQDGCYVYRLEPGSGKLAVVADDFICPNGLAFSPDESILYVSDTGVPDTAHDMPHIRAFDVTEGKRLSNGRPFARLDVGKSDGFRLDVDGNLWSSAGDGVHCFAPDGALLGKIRVPEKVSNVCFGGPKRNRLFITATRSLYAIYVGQNGVCRP
ncbi:MAG: SMP-30/gluconolactonase/LRE family protein [Rhodospirillales bacterium]|jgi:gluconolactonase